MRPQAKPGVNFFTRVDLETDDRRRFATRQRLRVPLVRCHGVVADQKVVAKIRRATICVSLLCAVDVDQGDIAPLMHLRTTARHEY
jgi:hypothetical protein